MPKTSTNETDDGIDQYNIDYIYNTFGAVDFGSDIIPSANNAYTLGNSSFYWQTGFITSINTAQLIVPSTGFLTIKNHLLPNIDNTWDLGSSNFRFRNVYVANLNFSQISGNTFSSSSGPLTFTTPLATDPVQINRDLVPSLNNTYRVGTSALKWLAVYGTTLFSNSIDGGGQPVVFNGSVRPINSGSYFLGSSDRVWAQGHITSLFNTTLNTRTVAGNTGGDLILTTSSAGNVISVDRHIVPVGTGLTNLGGSTNRYATVFTNSVDVPTLSANTLSSSTGNLLITAPQPTDLVTVNRDLVPSSNEGNNLGLSGQRWGNIRGASVITNLIGNGANTLSFDSSVAPLADLTKSLGTSSNRFLDANVGTVTASTVAGDTLTTSTHNDLLVTTANPVHKISVQRSVLPTSDGTLDLGSSSLKYNNLYCNVINAPSFNVDTISTATTTDLTLTTQSSSNTVKTPRNFTPTVTNTQTLGTSSLTWSQAYATTVFTGTVSNSGSPMLFNGSIRPSSDNIFFLGTTGLRFSWGYIRNCVADVLVETPIVRAGTALDLNLTTVTAGNNIVAQRNVLPNANNTLNLGSSSVRWATVFATTLNITTLTLNTLSSSSGNLTLTTPLSSDVIILDRTTTPSLDATYSLGSSSNRWLAVYAPTLYTSTLNTGAGDLSVTGNIVPSTDNTLSLGSSGQRFTAAHITTLNSTTVNTSTLRSPTSTDLVLTTTTAGNNISIARNLNPSSNNSLNLGSTILRYANVYAVNVNASSYNANTISSVSGNLLLTAPLSSDSVTTNRGFTPTVTDSQTLGTSTLRWSAIHAATGFFPTISNNNSFIDFAGGIRPNNDNQHWLGEITKRFQRAYVIDTFTNTIASTGTSDLLLTSPSSTQLITTNRSLRPTLDDTVVLGGNTYRWANIYGTYITANNIQSPSSQDLLLSCLSGSSNFIRTQTHLVPDQTTLYNLGSTTLAWNNGYISSTRTNSLFGLGGAITLNNSLYPVTNNSLSLGSSTSRFNSVQASTINTQTLNNPIGTEIQCSDNLTPSTTDTFNLGSTALRWNNTYTKNVFTDTLNAASGTIISVVHDFVPLVSFATDLGSSASKFAEGYIGELYTNSLRTLNNFGSLIRVFCDLVPEGVVNLGSAVKTYATGFFQNLTTQTLKANTGDTIEILSNIVPNEAVWSATIGGGAGVSNKFFRSVWAYSFYARKAETFGSLTSPVQTVSSTSLTTFTFDVDPASAYYAGPNLIRFPTVGFYMIHLNIRADTDLISPNYVEWTLYRTNNNTYYGHSQYHTVGLSNSIPILLNNPDPQVSLTFPYYCGDTADRLELRVKRGAFNVTGVALNAGSYVFRITGTSD
jgi:hypothetical protein